MKLDKPNDNLEVWQLYEKLARLYLKANDVVMYEEMKKRAVAEKKLTWN